MAQAETAKKSAGVKVLGSGCAKCHALEDATRKAPEELGMDSTSTRDRFCSTRRLWRDDHPALVVDGKVVSYGKGFEKGRGQSPHSEDQRVSV